MPERDWSTFACPNPNCSLYGQAGGTNIGPHGWSSKQRGIRCLRCTCCHKNFSERTGTPLFRAQLPQQTVRHIAEHLVEGNGMRPTSRLCGVSQYQLRGAVSRDATALQRPQSSEGLYILQGVAV
jgi:hypothetical protein